MTEIPTPSSFKMPSDERIEAFANRIAPRVLELTDQQCKAEIQAYLIASTKHILSARDSSAGFLQRNEEYGREAVAATDNLRTALKAVGILDDMEANTAIDHGKALLSKEAGKLLQEPPPTAAKAILDSGDTKIIEPRDASSIVNDTDKTFRGKLELGG